MAGPKNGRFLGTSTGSTGTAFTAGSNGSIVGTIMLVNDTDSTLTARVRVVPSGATEAAAHTIIPTTTLLPRDVIPLTTGITLAAGDTITALADTGVVVAAFGSDL